MLGSIKKKLIIVTDEKSTAYAELLSALVTIKDDNGDSIIGVKDGTVETVIWNEKVYADNQVQLGSGNKIVFLGKSNIAKAVASNVNCKNEFSPYGVFYGYISNKAVVYSDNLILSSNKVLYEEFYEKYCQFMKAVGTQVALDQIKEMVDVKKDNLPELEKSKFPFPSKTFGFLNKIDRVAAQGFSFFGNTKDVADQQNRCAVFGFYINVLETFLGE